LKSREEVGRGRDARYTCRRMEHATTHARAQLPEQRLQVDRGLSLVRSGEFSSGRASDVLCWQDVISTFSVMIPQSWSNRFASWRPYAPGLASIHSSHSFSTFCNCQNSPRPGHFPCSRPGAYRVPTHLERIVDQRIQLVRIRLDQPHIDQPHFNLLLLLASASASALDPRRRVTGPRSRSYSRSLLLRPPPLQIRDSLPELVL
jgi:hypothetical protein